MQIFSFIILVFLTLNACSDEPPPRAQSAVNQAPPPSDGGFGDASGMISDPCAVPGAPVLQAGTNNALPDLPSGGGPVNVEGFLLNGKGTGAVNPVNPVIPGVVNNDPIQQPSNGVSPLPSTGCGQPVGGPADEEDPYVYAPGTETDLKNCTDSGKLFDVSSGRCTNQGLASWECSESAIMDPSFTKIPASLKDLLRDDFRGQFSSYRLYGCVEKPNVSIELHFFKRKNDRTLTWDYWIMNY